MNDVLRVFVIPILFIFFNGLVEMILALSPNFAKPGEIKITYKDSNNDIEHLFLKPSKIIQMKDAHPMMVDVTHLDTVGTFNWWEYPSIALNLYFAALSVGAAALFSNKTIDIFGFYKTLYPLHIGLFLIVLFLCVIQRNSNDAKTKKTLGVSSLVISLATSIYTMFVLMAVL